MDELTLDDDKGPKKISRLESCHRLQKALLAHFLERERLCRQIKKVMGEDLGLSIHKNDAWVYEQISRHTDELERQAIEQACR